MSNTTRMMSTRKIIFIVSAFLAILTIFRLLWLMFYTTPDHPQASQGELDLRNWEPLSDHAITLDGEWEFFPGTFLMHDLVDIPFPQNGGNFIQVPGSSAVSANTSNAISFGSYRLRILVDPDKGNTYSIRMPDISSSSEVYINRELLARSGKLDEDKQQYKTLHPPYTAHFTLEKESEIDLVIHVANFDHPLQGGIVRSVTFGLTEPFVKKTTFAAYIVFIACIVYLFHALYSFILFLVGNRDRRLLYFSLLVLCVVLGTLIEKRLLFAWIPLNLEWRVKVTLLTMVAGGYFLLQCIRHLLSDFLRTKMYPPYVIVCGLSALAILLLPASYNFALTLFYTVVMLIPCLSALLVVYRAAAQIDKDTIYLLLAAIAAIGSLIWLLIIYALEIEMVSYPFDLMIATVCFSTYWFKRYFRVLAESQELTLELQKADKQKDDFLATVAHEMRNPLHGILNISQSVLEKEKAKSGKRNAKDLELLITIGRHMASLLNDLLDLERLKENRIDIQPEDISVHNIAEAVIDMLRSMTEGQPMKLVNQIPSNFPLVYADKSRLMQILFNLLHNAVNHSHANEVSVHASIHDGWAKIAVTDNGIGIDEALLSKIFNRYEQAAQDISSVRSGFGLGLSICKQLVELHGGSLEVDSKPDHGTVFTFTLQLSMTSGQTDRVTKTQVKAGYEQIAAAEVFHKKHKASDQSSFSDRVRVLAVDDDPVNLQVLESIFSAAPYEIFTATSGQEAMAMLDTGEWDVIIADVMMPQMSGYELTRMVRQYFSISELPILLLTARSQPEDIVAGFLAGANDYVTKPIEGLELKARINTLTNLKQSMSERLRMEAALLQAQIQPHFLFNTLNTIASLGEVDTTRMTNLLVEFGNYLRRSFDPKNFQQLVPLEHELELLNSYLFIEKERFGERLTIVWDVDKTIKLEIPPLSIQPLVENAIRHGILKRVEGGTVHIRIADRGHDVQIAIIDDGVGMNEEKMKHILEPENTRGIGVHNTNRRLKRMYGRGVQIVSQPDQGTTILFHIPKMSNSL